MGARARFSIEEMMGHVRSSETWPGGRSAYCKAQGLSMSALYRMRRKLAGVDQGNDGSGQKLRKSRKSSTSSLSSSSSSSSSLGQGFVFHPMLDPDGAALNYSWASKDFSYYEYLKDNFRNKLPMEDCEHGIPASDHQLIRPELGFFKKNIDKYKGQIRYYITLHTTHRLGG